MSGYQSYDTLAAGGRSGEARLRTLVGIAAVAALGAGVASVYLLNTADRRSTGWWSGWWLALAAVVVGAFCLWHGARREHERGRWFAVAGIIVAFPLLMAATWDIVRNDCLDRVNGRCVDVGRGR
ncbi:MAG TPA: hypothetical protein VNQ77_18060 [Frankiaceae bacterium]|nr:hypothetical protein [Frankiaceae bacterium]